MNNNTTKLYQGFFLKKKILVLIEELSSANHQRGYKNLYFLSKKTNKNKNMITKNLERKMRSLKN